MEIIRVIAREPEGERTVYACVEFKLASGKPWKVEVTGPRGWFKGYRNADEAMGRAMRYALQAYRKKNPQAVDIEEN